MVTIIDVEKSSIAQSAKILKGDKLLKINGKEINDCLDYRFYMTEKRLLLEILRDEQNIAVDIKKDEYDDLGLVFSTYLMDEKKTCRNKCIFCFIDQNPVGMRDSIYFKDDDSRLSFLFGNYVTLTNLSESDIERIIRMRISPVNISVHTTNKDLRIKMMNNKNAGNVLKYIDMLYKGEITLNFQIVLCKNVNDGEELRNSLKDLSKYFPLAQSIAVVPSGLTKYRQNLFQLKAFEKEDSVEVLKIIDEVAEENFEKIGQRLIYASDEWFLNSEKEIPTEEYYEEYPQIENGVGMIRSMNDEIVSEIKYLNKKNTKINNRRKISIITGKAAYKFILFSVDKIKEIWDNINVNVICAKNYFFGEGVTVTGLLTASDLIFAANGKDLGETLYVSKCMLKSDEDIFLDNITLSELEEKLNVKIVPLDNNGMNFVDNILGIE